MVAKCPIRIGSFMSIRQLRIQTIACFIADEFSARTAGLPHPYHRKVSYAPAGLMAIDGEQWLLEPFVEGT